MTLLKTWAAAQSYCREMFTDLATVENQDDNNNLLSVIQGSGENAWLGLYDDLNRWKWSLGNADLNGNVDFTSWLSGQPNNKYSNQFCVSMTNGLWNNNDCSAKYLAVCFDGKKQQTSLSSASVFFYISLNLVVSKRPKFPFNLLIKR